MFCVRVCQQRIYCFCVKISSESLSFMLNVMTWHTTWGRNLVPLGTETLNLNMFGDDQYKKQKCDVVQLFLKGRDGSRKMAALCFASLCSLLTTIDVCLYPRLLDLQLSDINILKGQQSDSSIDILIASYYFNILFWQDSPRQKWTCVN